MDILDRDAGGMFSDPNRAHDEITDEDPSRKPQSSSRDPHERYHQKHLELNENTTDALSDREGMMSLSDSRHPLKPRDVARMMYEMQRQIAALKEQLKSGNDTGNDNTFSHLPQTNADVEPKPLKQVEVVPKLGEVTWQQDFMNKYDNETKEYAIEVLIGGPGYKRKGNKIVLQEPEQVPSTEVSAPSPSDFASELSTVPDRIRINSPLILNFLATLDKSIDPSAPIVMFRPFMFLVHFEKRIRDHVQLLKKESKRSTETSEDAAGDKLKHVSCLVQFIDQCLKPTTTRLSNNTAQKICFRDLPYLFPPGEDIFMPLKNRRHQVTMDPTTVTAEMFHDRYERLWRVMGCGGGRVNLTVRDRHGRITQNAFKIHCYYIDFDGTYFCPTVHTYSIRPYDGEKDITSLDFFPLRFLKTGQELKEKTQAQGRLVFDALLQSHTHFYYRGPTLATHPCGCALDDELHQEHVESEVIVDYRTTLLKHPSWRPQTSFWKHPPSYPDELMENYRVRHWNNRQRTQLIRHELDTIYDDGIIDKERALMFKDNARIFDLIPSGWLSNEKSVPDEDIGLLSPRVFGFVLRTRSFAPVWLGGLQKISAQTDGLHSLQLRDNAFKDTIHALVRTHFLQVNAPKYGDAEYDAVRGKGKGLVFLLHGAPGVGKTFTAESVAAANGRPLFQITCGDLGLTPSEVEKALKEIFRYAQLWNCVLLLDECDIFLTQRTKTDLKRNSLVSVFLRVLEWYTGVLFLTTNRVGTLDSAVKSRVTWSTYYPPLNLQQTKEIWKTNLGLLEKRDPSIDLDRKAVLKFAREHFDSTIEAGTNWNGRQIQNAFKVALSLAGWATLSNEEQRATETDIAQDSDRRLKVTDAQFRTVAAAAEAFDDYLHEATGLTEAQRAFNAQERADEYQEEVDWHEEAPKEPVSRSRRASSTSQLPQPAPPVGRRTSNAQKQEQSQGRRTSVPQNAGYLRANGNSPRGSNHDMQKANGSGNYSALSPTQGTAQEYGAPKKKRTSVDNTMSYQRRHATPQPIQQPTPSLTFESETESGSDLAAEQMVSPGMAEDSERWD